MGDGHLYGSLIDILRLSAPLILVALGMTLVIATGGIDLSVGSLCAISGAIACLHISRQPDQNDLGGVLTALALGLGRGAEANAPLARAMVGAVIGGGLMTLVVVPALYTLFGKHLQLAVASTASTAPADPDR